MEDRTTVTQILTKSHHCYGPAQETQLPCTPAIQKIRRLFFLGGGAIHQKLSKSTVRILLPPRNAPWGMRSPTPNTECAKFRGDIVCDKSLQILIHQEIGKQLVELPRRWNCSAAVRKNEVETKRLVSQQLTAPHPAASCTALPCHLPVTWGRAFSLPLPPHLAQHLETSGCPTKSWRFME